MRTAIMVQARTGSQRLPNKVLLPLKNKPLILHVLERLKECQWADAVILVTTQGPEDRALIDLAEKQGFPVFAGSERDVLDRYYQAAKHFRAKNIVRCTGDCPVLDPEVTDKVIRCHFEKNPDYTSNAVIRSYPRGYDTEIMTFSALETAANEAQEAYQREHVTPFIFEQKDRFKIEHVIAGPKYYWPGLRLTVDTESDYELMKQVFDALYDKHPHFSLDEVMQLFRAKPELAELNAHIRQKSARSSQGG